MTATSSPEHSDSTDFLTEKLRSLPKVSLHDHLDGSLRPSTLIELASQAGHELPEQDPQALAERFRQNADSGSLEKYLEAFAHTTAVMQTADNLRRVAREYVEDLAADGVVYAEVRWAPEQHQQQGLSLDEAVEAVQSGLQAGMAHLEQEGRLIIVGQLISAMRQSDRADEVVQVALRHRDHGVVGFDIAGPEEGFPPSKFTEAFTTLASEMLPATVHAGEGDGVESVRDALVSGRAQRLGHGVRIAQDITVAEESIPTEESEVLEEDSEEQEAQHYEVTLGPVARWVRDRRIHLEVSPTSNLQTGASAPFGPDLADHPFDMLHQLGFNLGVNTDNRLVSGVTLSGELALLAETFDYDLADLADFQVNAMESSFLGHDEREALSAIILEGWR